MWCLRSVTPVRATFKEQDQHDHENYLSNSPSEWSDRKVLFRSNEIIQNFRRRKQYEDLPSPTSCLKSSGANRKKSSFEKKVNFDDEKYCQNYTVPSPKASPSLSNSSSYYDPPRYESMKWSLEPTRKQFKTTDKETWKHKPRDKSPTSTSDNDRRGSEYRRCSLDKNRVVGETKCAVHELRQSSESRRNMIIENSRNSSPPTRPTSDSSSKREVLRREANSHHHRHRHKHRHHSSPDSCKTRSSGSSTRMSTIDEDLVRVLKRMSVNTCTQCSSGVSVESAEKPRVLKPRDGLKRAALKRMLIYPPEGQIGAPLTLVKTWSNIDCQVKGNPSKGFRYKVYYIQKFESDKWFPNEKTGNPFHRKEDADYSTDYG